MCQLPKVGRWCLHTVRRPSAVCRLPLRTAPQTKRRPPCSVFFVLVLGLCSFFLVLLFTPMRTGADSDARRTAAARAPSGTAPATKSSASVTGAESRGTRPAREGRLLWRKPSQCVSLPNGRRKQRGGAVSGSPGSPKIRWICPTDLNDPPGCTNPGPGRLAQKMSVMSVEPPARGAPPAAARNSDGGRFR